MTQKHLLIMSSVEEALLHTRRPSWKSTNTETIQQRIMQSLMVLQNLG